MKFQVKSEKKEEIIDITNEVKKAVSELWEREKKSLCNKKSCACLVYVPHATCAIIVNENYDKAVCEDILDYLRKQIPAGKWKHDKIDSNADSHIKASIIGPGQMIPIKDGKLQLGTWQNIGLSEFDGPRERKVIVKLI